MDRVSIERMCAGREFQVKSADTEKAREEKLLVIPAGLVIAKFHYTDPTGPARTQRSFAAKKSVRVRAGPVGSVSGPCSGI